MTRCTKLSPEEIDQISYNYFGRLDFLSVIDELL
ncbi:hypothetical protein HNQ76_002173 [Thermosulfuriphilus ammonigenes]|nr:hypothetical protein [Thermosulfuriphilus ammonigenes]